MADIKQVKVDNTTYNIKDEVARQQLETKQPLIESVSSTYAENGGSPSAVASTDENGNITFNFQNLKLKFSDLTDIEKESIRGHQGTSAVFDPETGNILASLENTTGQSTANAMTQKAVTDALRNITDVAVKVKTTSDIIHNAGRVNSGNWNVKNNETNPSDGFYMNVVAYRGMRVKITPQSGKRVRVGFTQNILIRSGATTTDDFALVDGTSVSNGTAIVYADGYSDVIYPAANVAIDVVIPNNCNYLWCSYLYGSNGDMRPASIEFFESKTINTLNTELREVISANRNRISNLEYISISAGKLSDKTVKQRYRVVINGRVDNKGTAGTAVLIPNTGYSKVSIDATYWTSSIAAIAFYNNTNASSSNLISAVEMVSGTTHYEQDVPDGCELIGFTYKTSADSIDNITLYINSIERIKNLGKNLPSSTSLDRGVLLNQARAVTPTPVTLLHISDVHGNTQALQAIRNFYEEYSNYIDDIINTGDLATNTYNTTDADNYNNLGYTDALFVIGNHDGATSTGSTKAEWIAAGREACYNTYFSNIGEWGVTQPEGASESHLMYYYKDYTEAKVRLIVLDCMFISETGTTYSDDQYAWFREKLKETLVESNSAYGYTVVVASHYIPGNYFNECLIRTNDDKVVSFHTGGTATPNAGVYNGTINSRFRIENRFPQAVQDFIDGNGYFDVGGLKGNFAIWLCGHHHNDIIAYAWTGFTNDVTNSGSPQPTEYLTEYKITGMNGGQPVVEAVQTPSKYPVSDVLFSAVTRAAGTADARTLDEFFPAANAVTITSTYIKIIRFGFSLTTSLRPMNVLVYNFKTKKVIENY